METINSLAVIQTIGLDKKEIIKRSYHLNPYFILEETCI